MKTCDVERELGLTKHTIYFYEKEGFIHPQRDENGYRNYSNEDISILQMVKFLRNMNISIEDVKGILNGKLQLQECLMVNKINIEKQLESLKDTKKILDCYYEKNLPLIPELNEVISHSVNTNKKCLGIHKTTNTVTLGRKLTQSFALRQLVYVFLEAIVMTMLLTVFTFLALPIELSQMTKLLIRLVIFIVLVISFIGVSFTQTSVAMVEEDLNQFVEFVKDGVYLYKRNGFFSQLKYFIYVLLKKDDQLIKYYPYEDISKVEVLVNKRYMSIASPIAYECYVADFKFYFKDGYEMYFYWPTILDDDARYISVILKNKVSNIQDKNQILYAMKEGINITDYMSHR